MLRLLPLVTLVAVTLAAVPAVARAGGPTMALGVAEDAVRAPDLVSTYAKLSQVRLAGFTSVRITSNWTPGATAPSESELVTLQNIQAAAQLHGVRVFVSIYQPGSKTTPLTPEARAEFAAYAAALVTALPSFDDVIVGNEPNLNRFWLPQFNPDGTNASAAAYLQLLAQVYDAIEAVDPGVRVWGGALAPRGSDRPQGIRPTTSPTAFIRALGVAYRASGRTTPVMDGLTHHPYPDTSSQLPSFPHPNSTTIGLADYDKLVALLAEAFDGTAQPGSSLPILYDEFGIESIVPAGKAKLYSGTEPVTTKPVDERAQAAAYDLGLRIAFCQPTVVGMLLFHSHDETALPTWQSGVYYADGSRKASFAPVQDSLARTRGGSITHCDGLALDVEPQAVRFPTATAFAKGKRDTRFRCSLDCAWELRVTRVSTGSLVTRVRGYGRSGTQLVASLTGRKLGATPVRLTLSVSQPVNPGLTASRESKDLQP